MEKSESKMIFSFVDEYKHTLNPPSNIIRDGKSQKAPMRRYFSAQTKNGLGKCSKKNYVTGPFTMIVWEMLETITY